MDVDEMDIDLGLDANDMMEAEDINIVDHAQRNGLLAHAKRV